MSNAAVPGEYRLFGIGVGPGDPELITVKAVNALLACDVVLVPSTEASGSGAGRAETIVRASCPEIGDRIIRVPFSMADRSGVTGRRANAWQASAERAIKAFESGARQVGFATIGDPSVYSTFSYLAAGVRSQLPQVAVRVVPGITAMQALAAASCTPLVEGDEILTLVPLKHGTEQLAEVASVADTCVIYKAGRHIAALREYLNSSGREAIAGINVGLPGEQVVPVSELAEAPYFTSVLIPAHRTGTGDRL
ncbi:MAG: precorrin-2 C(20)-methyltransferase [Brooklawnia sp.]|jgi:precorrin-2/cobalt-factor-2 C20-methyltransferase